ncbi:MAG TPA: DUF1015 domain-containing protein [Candidatus Dormibacteraeota bacterium]|nr:DUF1015 domain-containing protein [Candidatus Dormibacteraeota bacterium]
MADIIPFHGLRYDEKVVGDLANVIAPPYDVISPARQDELYAKSPFNIVRIELAKAEPGDDEIHNRYARAKRALEEWTEQGALRIDYAPGFYLYDHLFPYRGRRLRRRGFFGALRLYDWGRGIVRPHEQTFAGPKQDRLWLLRATRANVSPVFTLFDDADGRVRRYLEDAIAHGPAELVADVRDGEERHLLFRMDDRFATKRIVDAFAERRLYIADGHHRYETARDYFREQQQAGRIEVDNDTSAYVLTYFAAMQDDGLLILPTHRVIRGGTEAVERALARSFARHPVDAGAIEDQQPPITVALDSQLAAVEPTDAATLERLPAAWRDLPVAQAEELLIRPAREAGAEVSYTHELDDALAAAKEGAVSVLLRPVTADTIKRVADEWERLPQKTTYFYPKVPTGLVIRPLGA